MNGTVEERFWAKVDASGGPAACWAWNASRDGFGYGHFATERRRIERAHRVSWRFSNGRSIPDGVLVLHRCDNPWCVNPAHLWLGTDADNVRDAVAKRRARGAVGERNQGAKLTESQVLDVRRRYREGARQVDIAAAFGIRQTTVSQIVRRETWAHVR